MSSQKWIVSGWLLTLPVALGLGYHFGHGTEPAPSPNPPVAATASRDIASAPVKRQELQANVVAVGNLTIDPNRESRAGSPLSGRVAAVYASVGDRVFQGQPLATITSPEITKIAAEHHHAELRLAQARASYAQSDKAIRLGDESRRPLEESRTELVTSRTELEVQRSARRLSEQNLKRVEGLYKLGVASTRDLEVARAELTEARARERQAGALTGLATQHRNRELEIVNGGAVIGPKLTQLKTELELAEEEVRHLDVIMQNLDLQSGQGLVLKAPRGGTVIERHVSLGQAVTADEELFRIVDSGQLWLWIHLQEADLPLVPLNSKVTLKTGKGVSFPGRVSYLAPLLEPETRTLKARVVVDNRSARLKAGMFVQAHFEVRKARRVLAVPPDAVVVEGTSSVVFRSQGQGWQRVRVDVGERTGDWVEVKGELKEGELVAANGLAALELERR